jgi:hypothetical protein
MTSTTTPQFELDATSDHYIRTREGDTDLTRAVLALGPDERDTLLSDLYRYIVASDYPDTKETLGLVQYVLTPDYDESGNNIFASVQYDNEGHLATLGGHSEPIGDAGEGHRIAWQTYMD